MNYKEFFPYFKAKQSLLYSPLHHLIFLEEENFYINLSVKLCMISMCQAFGQRSIRAIIKLNKFLYISLLFFILL